MIKRLEDLLPRSPNISVCSIIIKRQFDGFLTCRDVRFSQILHANGSPTRAMEERNRFQSLKAMLNQQKRTIAVAVKCLKIAEK